MKKTLLGAAAAIGVAAVAFSGYRQRGLLLERL